MNNQSENLNELATALAKCQGEITPAIKDAKNPFFKSKYADLNSVWSVCREPLSKHGLAVIQTIDKDESGLILLTTLIHSSGQWIRSRSPIPLLKTDPQAMGSSITYMRRYSLSAIVGISTDEDDDGEKAMNRNSKKADEEEKIRQQQEKERFEKEEHEIYMSFISQYPEENADDMGIFFATLKDAWQQPRSYVINKYRDHEKFLVDFGKWKVKHGKTTNV